MRLAPGAKPGSASNQSEFHPAAAMPTVRQLAIREAGEGMILDLDGKQIVISSDLGKIRLSLWAYRGSMGIELTPDQAKELGLLLFRMGRGKRG
jgi:hypothetical protein